MKDGTFFLVALAVVAGLLLVALVAPCWLVDVTPGECLAQFVRGGC